jgi:hypothetical protein
MLKSDALLLLFAHDLAHSVHHVLTTCRLLNELKQSPELEKARIRDVQYVSKACLVGHKTFCALM